MSLIVLIGVIGIWPTTASAFTIIVTENDVPLVPNSILQLAQQLGYFERAGVHVDFLHATGTPLAIAALLSREGDMANISVDALLALSRQKQTDFRAVSAPAKPIPYVLAATSAVSSVKDLAGKTFGIGQAGTLDATLTERLFAKAGVNKSVNMVNIGPPVARVKALVNGRIDATTISIGTWAMIPAKSGLHMLVDRGSFDAVAPPISKLNVVALETLGKKRHEILRVTIALMELSRRFRKDPHLWSEALADSNTRASKAILSWLAELYRDDWCADDCLNPDDLASSIHLLGGNDADVNALADFSVVKQARSLISRSGQPLNAAQ